MSTLMRIGWRVDAKRSGPACQVLEPRAGHIARMAREVQGAIDALKRGVTFTIRLG